jgi:flagellar biosynthetic protein FlhB
MSEKDGQEKKHDPGEKKWQEAADRGQIPKSSDFSAAAVLITGAAVMTFAGGSSTDAMKALATHFFSVDGSPLTVEAMVDISHHVIRGIGTMLALPLGAVLVAAVLANAAQTRLRLAPEALELKWDRLDALSGFKSNYMSWTPLVELVKGLAKVFILGAVGWYALSDRIDELPALAMVPTSELMTVLVELAWIFMLCSTPVILIIAIGDYAYSWYQLNDQLMRTDQELKDDQKQMEGDPRVKHQRRAFARKLLVGGGLTMVREADVVITNPTHYAIALRYRRGEDVAPTVVAKGVDHLAAQIRAEALRAGVPRIEDRPLARALYAKVPLGGAIPEELFTAVARVLAIIYRRRAKRKGA